MNLNKFFELLMNNCWHEWEWKPKDGDIHIYECKCGLRVGSRPQNPDHLSNPLPVLEWMQENMPREFEAYCRPQRVDRPSVYPSTDYVFRILDLSNLAQWLIDHPEWSYMDCSNLDLDDYVCRNFSPECECELGRIVHPALEYAKETQ